MVSAVRAMVSLFSLKNALFTRKLSPTKCSISCAASFITFNAMSIVGSSASRGPVPGPDLCMTSWNARSAPSPRHHKAAALRSSLRSEIDDPVRCLNDVEMMLDNDHRVSKVCQPTENVQKLFNIIEMQASRGFVENIKSFSRCAPAQFFRQFNPLSFTAGQCGCRLAKTDVTQSHINECL